MIKIVTRDISHCERFVRKTLTANAAIAELNPPIAVTEIRNSTELPIQTQLQANLVKKIMPTPVQAFSWSFLVWAYYPWQQAVFHFRICNHG